MLFTLACSRPRLRAARALTASLAALLAVACDGGGPLGPTDAGPQPDGEVAPTALLELTSAPIVTLAFGESAEVSVRYTDLRGAPEVGAPVRLGLVGRANDSSLSSTLETSDEDGVVRATVTAGGTPSTFQIEVGAEGALPVHVDVSVGAAGFGNLVVSVTREGDARPLTRREVTLFAERACDDPALREGPGDRSPVRLPLDEGTATFGALPAELRYAAVARGFGARGALLAWGCTDRISVVSDDSTEAAVSMRDLPYSLEGSFGAEVAWSAPLAADLLATAVRTGGAGPIDAAGGDGALLLDAMVATLAAGGDLTSADALAAARSAEGLDAALDARLASDGVGPSIALESLAAELGARTRGVAIDGMMAFGGPGAGRLTIGWTTTAVVARTADGSAAPLPLDLGALGHDPMVRSAGNLRTDDDVLELSFFRASLPLGAVGTCALRSMAAERGATDTARILEGLGGCATLARWARGHASVAAHCDAVCAEAACGAALAATAEAIDRAIVNLDGARDELTLAGDVQLRDDRDDLRIDGLTSAALSGTWRSTDGASTETVTGGLTGTRAIE